MYKKKHTLEQRLRESENIIKKYPTNCGIESGWDHTHQKILQKLLLLKFEIPCIWSHGLIM